ncbi:MAG: hypothetical protein K2J66_07195 [Muribaculaceae bacterium]|nr:hypothetical protein [Muribaculaceae bacterium]
MKKLISTLFALAVIVSMTVLTSCGSKVDNATVGKIVEKYDNGDDLTEAEYGTLLDYVDAAMDDALPIIKDMQDAVADGDMVKLQKLTKKGEELDGKYEYMDKAGKILDKVDESELGEANVKKIEALAKKISDATGMDISDIF